MSNLDMVALEAALEVANEPATCTRSPEATVKATIEAYLRASGLQAELDGLRSIVQTYSEAHEAAVRQGVQMRDRMEEAERG